MHANRSALHRRRPIPGNTVPKHPAFSPPHSERPNRLNRKWNSTTREILLQRCRRSGAGVGNRRQSCEHLRVEIRRRFAANIRAERQRLGLTQERAAKQILEDTLTLPPEQREELIDDLSARLDEERHVGLRVVRSGCL